ncbi:MAG: type II toxin-antitoxin system VapC family toxin [Candidatus Phosphoribacter baldrii]
MTIVILDTNVISEAMRGSAGNVSVVAWLQALPALPVTTVVNRAEILAGIALLAPGRRREELHAAAEAAFDGLGVCLPLTSVAAGHYAEIVARRRRVGRPIGGMDALIAAIARQNGATLATRDTDGFADLGVELVDPWAYRP